eukprot:6194737-Pleurochrysis_carterae.AAC.1
MMRVTGMKQPGSLGETRRELDEDASLGANSFFFHDASDRSMLFMARTPRSSAGLAAPGPQQVAQLKLEDRGPPGGKSP